MTELWDVAIIGGGLAGSAAAIELARAGQRVVLLEKESGPHDKVCGEFISIEAQHDLQALSLDLDALHAVPLHDVRISNARRTVASRLPFTAKSLSRRVLDEALLVRATQSGVTLRRGAMVTGLTRQDDHWTIDIRDQPPLCSRSVCLATGKHDLRGWKREMPSGEAAVNELIGFKMYFRLSATEQDMLRHHVELYLFADGYAGLEPVEENRANLCLVVAKTRFAACSKHWEALLHDLAAGCPLLAQRLRQAVPLWDKPLSIFGLPYGFVHDSNMPEPDLYRLGDQMAVIPSFCGDGMAIALATGRLVARYVLRRDAAGYQLAANNMLQAQINRAMWVQRLTRHAAGRKIMLLCCRVWPGLLRIATRWTRVRTPDATV